MPLSPSDNRIHTNKYPRQPLERDKGLHVCVPQAEETKAGGLCLIFIIIISINTFVQLSIHPGIVGAASLVCLEP